VSPSRDGRSLAQIDPAGCGNQLNPALIGMRCEEYRPFKKTAGIPKSVAAKNIAFHEDSLHRRPNDTDLKFQEGRTKGHLFHDSSLPATFTRDPPPRTAGPDLDPR